MVIRRCILDKIGGFDPEHYSQSLFDADLCLRLSESGFRIVFTPYAELIETSRSVITEPDEKAIDYFCRRWRAVLNGDPFYNPNFTDQGEPFKYRV
jgi:GT2 family glycosyltransferase